MNIKIKDRFGAVPFVVLEKLASGEIKKSDFAVYVAIAVHANKHGYAEPVMSTLAKITGMLRTTMTGCVTRLVDAKLVETNGERRRGKRVTYTLIEHPFIK